MQIFYNLYTRLSYNILHLLFAYTDVFSKIKKNKRIKSTKTVNRIFRAGILQAIREVNLSEYIDVFCMSNLSEGALEISATLLQINDSEFGGFFIEKFIRLKEFILQNNLTIVYDEIGKCYLLKGSCGTFKYDDEEVVRVLYLENKLTGLLTDN